MSINFGDFFLFAIDTIFANYVDSTFVCSGGSSCVSLLFVRLPARFANANYVRLLQLANVAQGNLLMGIANKSARK